MLVSGQENDGHHDNHNDTAPGDGRSGTSSQADDIDVLLSPEEQKGVLSALQTCLYIYRII